SNSRQSCPDCQASLKKPWREKMRRNGRIDHLKLSFLRMSVCVLVAFISAAIALGQATTSIRGILTDPSGAVIPGVSVTLENIGTNASRNTLTDETGTYQILQVQPGAYRIRAELTGFKTIVRENIELLVNTPTTLDLKFESVGQLSETVDVSAQSGPLVST